MLLPSSSSPENEKSILQDRSDFIFAFFMALMDSVSFIVIFPITKGLKILSMTSMLVTTGKISVVPCGLIIRIDERLPNSAVLSLIQIDLQLLMNSVHQTHYYPSILAETDS